MMHMYTCAIYTENMTSLLVERMSDQRRSISLSLYYCKLFISTPVPIGICCNGHFVSSTRLTHTHTHIRDSKKEIKWPSREIHRHTLELVLNSNHECWNKNAKSFRHSLVRANSICVVAIAIMNRKWPPLVQIKASLHFIMNA